MATCTSCGSDVTGKKFCQQCGTPAQAPTSSETAPSTTFCSSCGRQGTPGEKFCSNCGTQLGASGATPVTPVQQPTYSQPQYSQPQPQAQYEQPQYPPSQYDQSQYAQSQYGQPQYPQQPYGQPQYPQQPYGQPQYPQQPGQMGYQPQPMMGQQPMVLRCPVCMAMSPLGTPACPGCHTNLAGVVPTPAEMPNQAQQGGMMGGLGGMLQGNGGKYAMGALGGAAAVLGGEALLHGLERH